MPVDATQDPPLMPPRTLPPLLGPFPALPTVAEVAASSALPSGRLEAMDNSSGARRDRARRAMVAAEVNGSLHKLVADARRASHRCELPEVWRRAGNHVVAAPAWTSGRPRPRWHLWLAALELMLLISLLVLLVGGVAYSLGQCMTLPWQKDIQRSCTASCCLGSTLILICVWATIDRHCRCRFRFQDRPNTKITDITGRSENGYGNTISEGASTCGTRLAPNPAELCVEYTTALALPRRSPSHAVLGKDGSSSFDVVSVGELASMIIDGDVPPHSRVRAAQGECNRIASKNQLTDAADRAAAGGTSNANSSSVEHNPWVMMNSFIDMSMPMELDIVKNERRADLVERL